jgi:hypothetical protein
MSAGLENIGNAFRRCIGELGMWSASRLFVDTARTHGGDEAVAELRATLGAEFPVLDVVASSTGVAAVADGAPVAELCRELRRLVIVGLESNCLAPLVARLPASLEIVLILDSTFPIDVERVRASWSDRVTLTDLASFQRFAGTRSALLTTVYGADGYHAVVSRLWLRLHGEDVRTQFRSLIGWNVIGGAMRRYPRWLVETNVADFTDIVEQ